MTIILTIMIVCLLWEGYRLFMRTRRDWRDVGPEAYAESLKGKTS